MPRLEREKDSFIGKSLAEHIKICNRNLVGQMIVNVCLSLMVGILWAKVFSQ